MNIEVSSYFFASSSLKSTGLLNTHPAVSTPYKLTSFYELQFSRSEFVTLYVIVNDEIIFLFFTFTIW